MQIAKLNEISMRNVIKNWYNYIELGLYISITFKNISPDHNKRGCQNLYVPIESLKNVKF